MQLFYNPNISESDSTFSFDKDESRHIVKVLRKKEGDTLNITNGKGWLFNAKLILANQKQCEATIVEKSLQKKRDFTLHIAIAPTKMNERFEWFLEKATEIGIEEITPILCDNSERKVIKTERFEKIIQSAMKQSLNFYLPKLNLFTSFKDFIEKDAYGLKFIAHCEDIDKQTLKSQLKPNKDCIILIGPEGDFSSVEINQALQSNFKPISLGETRLRTETAGIVACHSVAFVNEL